jgi:gentisate 1,2-dioxygenase
MEGPLLKLHHGRDRMVAGFTTTCAISAHHHLSCEFEPCLWQGVLDTTLCDQVWSVAYDRSVVILGHPGFLH